MSNQPIGQHCQLKMCLTMRVMKRFFQQKKRQKTYFSTEPNITEKIVPLHEFSSQQECVIDKQQYDNTKQYTFLHGHPSSIIIANTRTLQHKAKTRAQTATKKN